MANDNQITSPILKAGTALGASAGASAAAANNAGSFLPTDLAGWMAVAASTIAVIYTAHLLAEWWWKKFWRGFFVRRGWIGK